MRCHCTLKPFNLQNTRDENNKKTCEQCFCYVCDKKAGECGSWGGSHYRACDQGAEKFYWRTERNRKKTGGVPAIAPMPNVWAPPAFNNPFPGLANAATADFGGGTADPALTAFPASTTANKSMHTKMKLFLKTFEDFLAGAPSVLNSGEVKKIKQAIWKAARRSQIATFNPYAGPWKEKPSLPGAYSSIERCDHCKYYTNTKCDPTLADRSGLMNTIKFTPLHDAVQQRTGQDYLRYANTAVSSTKDWCHACARVMKKTDLGKMKCHPLTDEEKSGQAFTDKMSYCIGTKEVEFTLDCHDPRSCGFGKSTALWNCPNSTFKYNERASRQEVFDHRIGTRPSAQALLLLIGPCPAPKTATRLTAPHVSRHSPAPVDTDTFEDLDRIRFEDPSVAMLLSKLADTDEFFERVPKQGGGYDKVDMRGILYQSTATFNPTTGKGKINFKLYIRNQLLDDMSHGFNFKTQHIVTEIIGLWFGALPFRLSEIYPRKLDIISEKYKDNTNHQLVERAIRCFDKRQPLTRFGNVSPLTSEMKKGFLKELLPYEKKIVSAHNKRVTEIKEGDDSLYSFTGSSKFRGGICSDDISLKGHYRSLCTELITEESDLLSDNYGDNQLPYQSKTWHFNQRLKHQDSLYTSHTSKSEYMKALAYVHREDIPMVYANAIVDIKKSYAEKKSLNGVLNSLESLGHRNAPDITSGFNVNLHNYQKQAVGFMLDRETTDNRKLLWTKLPGPFDENDWTQRHSAGLWFSPVLGMFSTSPPSLGRGGFMCEEMGMGKTVISLAIILQNPAPIMPPSGTRCPPANNSFLTEKGWSRREERKHADETGSVFCAGTLVVCPVSLVGQWVEEARNKLSDPGLVYPYYGGNRTKDPEILSKKSIVVTTYAVLASDNGYWRKKAAEPENYVSPCQKLRWWRIILDESHAIKQSATNHTKAVKMLVGENRWCVTGTPFNNSIDDINSQAQFLGLNPFNERLMKMLFSTPFTRLDNQYSWRRRHNMAKEMAKMPTPGIAFFLTVMRKILMRHTKEQNRIGSGTGLVTLPPKTKKTIYIDFTVNETAGYRKWEDSAKRKYMAVRRGFNGGVMKNTLALLAALGPLRDVCSGGREPNEVVRSSKIDGAGEGYGGKKAKPTKPPYQMDSGDDMECSICLDAFEAPIATSCKSANRPHIFCRDCIEGMIGSEGESTGNCPLCRDVLKIGELRDALLPKIKPDPGMASPVKGEPDADEPLGVGTRPTDFTYDSKLKRLVQELKRINDNEPGAKSLIFSQFSSTLEWLKQELPKNGFQFRTLSGGMSMTARAKALKDFQGDPPTTIFLLSLRAGAVGINLTEANRVFLMEPALNPALEAQAVGRVHRLGQTKPVEIIRFVVKKSIEERIVKIQTNKYKTGGAGGAEGAEGGEGGDGGGGEDEAAEMDRQAREQRERADAEMARRLAEEEAGHVNSDKLAKTAVKIDEWDQYFGLSQGEIAAAGEAVRAAR
ncbi:hypothetical protein TrLO_g5881 [Triparma laevis f. longispina]|nr:hypothetical protein TrLO_g5881 [Triparma laevis f. longispina]